MSIFRFDLFFKRCQITLLAIFLIALTFRVLFVFFYNRMGEDFWLGADLQYDRIASNIASGRGYYMDGNLEGLDQSLHGKEKFYSFRSPLYPYILAGLYTIFGRSVITVGICQALVSSLTVLLLFFIGRKLFDERVGLGTALIAAVYPYGVYHDIRVFDNFLFEFILGLLILSILRLGENPTTLNSILIGLLMGLAILCRSAFVTFTAFFFLPFLISYRFSLKKVLRIAMVIVFVECIVLSPWLLRNYLLHNRIVLSTYGGWNFLLGNNELTFQEVQNRREGDLALSRYLKNSSVTLTHLTESEMDQWFFHKGIEFIKNNPDTFLKLICLKIVNFWNVRLIPASSPWKELIYSLSYGTILFLSLPGIVLSLKQWRKFFLIYLLLLYFTVSYIPFAVVSRYRKPVDPYLIMFGIYGVIYLYEKLQQHRFQQIQSS
jgi:4-amino-4-deoxy-L-arabinose transferase-like glycosyltransferase